MSPALIRWRKAARKQKPLRAWPVGDDIEQARQRLINSWNQFSIVEVTQPLVEKAGRFADVFALRGYDSLQLAAAQLLQLEILQ